MKGLKRILAAALCVTVIAGMSGCASSVTGGKRIIRISHAQSETTRNIWVF